MSIMFDAVKQEVHRLMVVSGVVEKAFMVVRQKLGNPFTKIKSLIYKSNIVQLPVAFFNLR